MIIKDEYTVYEVAELLQTNPETIRKWIREGDLSAEPGNSKKEGIRIYDDSLQDFLTKDNKCSKKYAKIALTSATAALITGGIAIPAFLAVKAYQENQALASAIIKSSDLLALLGNEIQRDKNAILELQERIASLEKEIDKKNTRINSILQMISELKGNNYGFSKAGIPDSEIATFIKKHNSDKIANDDSGFRNASESEDDCGFRNAGESDNKGNRLGKKHTKSTNEEDKLYT